MLNRSVVQLNCSRQKIGSFKGNERRAQFRGPDGAEKPERLKSDAKHRTHEMRRTVQSLGRWLGLLASACALAWMTYAQVPANGADQSCLTVHGRVVDDAGKGWPWRGLAY